MSGTVLGPGYTAVNKLETDPAYLHSNVLKKNLLYKNSSMIRKRLSCNLILVPSLWIFHLSQFSPRSSLKSNIGHRTWRK